MTAGDAAEPDDPTIVSLDFDWDEPEDPDVAPFGSDGGAGTDPEDPPSTGTDADTVVEPVERYLDEDVDDLLEGYDDYDSPEPETISDHEAVAREPGPDNEPAGLVGASTDTVEVVEAPPDEFEDVDDDVDGRDGSVEEPFSVTASRPEQSEGSGEASAGTVAADAVFDMPVRPRFEYLPIVGDGAPVIDAQARDAENLNDDTLMDLISSIGTMGVLEPILVEQVDESTVRLVAGERRLRACRWLLENTPDNPHVAAGIPALVAPTGLTEEQRRSWQFNENFARQDLTLHETGAALLWMRCALLSQRLVTAGHAIPGEVTEERDPVKRWAALEEFRVTVGAARIGAPWPDVVKALRVQMSPARAAKLVKAFSTLPEGIGTEMDANQISLHSRLKWLTLRQRDETKADEVWTTVRDTDPTLLPAAVDAAMQHPEASVEEVVIEASEVRDEANEARAAAAAAMHTPVSYTDDDSTDVGHVATVDWVDASDAAASAVAQGDVVIAQKVAKYAKPAADKMSRLMRELEDPDVVIEAAQAERLNTLCVQLLDAIEDQKRPRRRNVTF